MLWPILCVIVFLIFAYYSPSFDLSPPDVGFILILSCAIFFVGVGITVCVSNIMLGGFTEHWEEDETMELVGLRDQSGVQGHFVLGSGDIAGKQHYYFYKKVGNGYQPGHIPVDDNVTIFEDDIKERKREAGELKVYALKFTRPFVPISAWLLIDLPPMPRKKYEFFIPAGSLKKSFAL